MKGIPEWFIAGPLHGKDRLTEFPGRMQLAYRVLEPKTVHATDHPGFLDYDPQEWVYTRQRFTIGARIIIMWVDLSRTSREYAATLLADVLLAPHETPDPEEGERTAEIRKTDAEMLAEAVRAENADKSFAERMDDELCAPCPCGSGTSSLLCKCGKGETA